MLLVKLPTMCKTHQYWLLTLLLIGLSPTAAAQSCPSNAGIQHFSSNGWGLGASNQRYQNNAEQGLRRDNIGSLELAWAFALDSDSPHSYPLVTEDTVFIGTTEGRLLALDRDTGCLRWEFEANGGIRTGIVHGQVTTGTGTRPLLFFGTFQGRVHAVDPTNGTEVWQRDVRTHPFAVVTGTPAFHNNKLYVPVSSIEVVLAAIPIYSCCKFRGSMVALDPATGTNQWRTFTINTEAEETGSHYFFVEEYGPSGAPVWSAPTIDADAGQLYFGTGENYSAPATNGSDAIFALALADGKVRWRQQFTEQDAYNMSCETSAKHPNCPEENGPDLDFGAPPILATTKDGQRLLLVGQKSGDVRALNPNDGEVLWQHKLGRGGKLGGVHWGMALAPEPELLLVPMSDRSPFGKSPDETPGLTALNIRTGEVAWTQPAADGCGERSQCSSGFSAAIIATNDIVFAGQLNGLLSGYDITTGELLWQVDTWGEVEAVNGTAVGGAIDVHGPMVAGDNLFVSSGYGSFGQRGGNAFLAYRLKPNRNPSEGSATSAPEVTP